LHHLFIFFVIVSLYSLAHANAETRYSEKQLGEMLINGMGERRYYEVVSFYAAEDLASALNDLNSQVERAKQISVDAQYARFLADQQAWEYYYDQSCLFFGEPDHPRSKLATLICKRCLVQDRIRNIQPWLGLDDLYGFDFTSGHIKNCRDQ